MANLVALAFLVALVTYLILKFLETRRRFAGKGVPNPPELPFIGVMGKNAMAQKHMVDVLAEIYGFQPEAKYVGCHFFLNPMVVIRDLDLIKSVLIKDFDYFADRKVFVDEDTDPLFGKNLVSLNGPRWKEVRSILTPSFTTNKMRAMFVLMSKCADTFSRTLLQTRADSPAIDMKDTFTRYANDVIASCAFGFEVDSLKDPDNEFYVNGRESLAKFGRFSLESFIMFFVPALGRRLGLQLIPKKNSCYFIDLIDKTMKERREKGRSRPDMLQLLMDAQDKTHDLDVLDITAQAYLFFLGGFETVSTQMCWMAHEMAIHQDIQRRVQEEIDQMMRDCDGQPTYEAINNLNYLDAVFSETLRVHPLPTLNRVCAKEFVLPPAYPGAEPFVVEPGIEIVVPVHSIQHDPQYYDEPDRFEPERFADKRSTTSDVVTLGFGLGPRMCIGNRFAILETKIVFVHLLAKCNLVTCDKTCVPTRYDKRIFMPTADGGFWLKIEPREKSA
ncbi:cytochrome P450 9e2-like [Trichogramma pretiosum]|uniref:cytochrome P450 9e2-like n=1 Tax=Trichogramma pretiosum TaxID=7493 RepID=UPI0006C9DB8A|nr:cytochrome P450 9e2-like [Trichogramma pretiosum]